MEKLNLEEINNFVNRFIQDDEVDTINIEIKRIDESKCKNIFGHRWKFSGGGSCSTKDLENKDFDLICLKCKKEKRISITIIN